MQSVAMRSGERNPRKSGLTVVSAGRTNQPFARFVRLSQLRKLCECEQVAAVCYRVRGGGIEFLLVRTRGGGRWTFPKGSAEPGLTHAQAAALEAFEEAGVHGRIEEASFATYVRRERGVRKLGSRSGGKDLAVNAHLCEVSRLSPPKESGRNRTWFSVEEAKSRLREGRESDDGAEFARVVDRAAARIRRLRGEIGIPDDGPRPDRPAQEDGLRRVQFEAYAGAETAREGVSFMPYVRRQLAAMRQAAVHADVAGEVLPCEVLPFDPRHERKIKALGTGANLRG